MAIRTFAEGGDLCALYADETVEVLVSGISQNVPSFALCVDYVYWTDGVSIGRIDDLGNTYPLGCEHPTIAALSYAYGNFLASNQRWPAAQQAYFRALQLAKTDSANGGLVNPDYAFNLAVSLEHLNQSEPAQNYYREALSLSANHPASFDLAAVRSRLASMAGNSSNE